MNGNPLSVGIPTRWTSSTRCGVSSSKSYPLKKVFRGIGWRHSGTGRCCGPADLPASSNNEGNNSENESQVLLHISGIPVNYYGIYDSTFSTFSEPDQITPNKITLHRKTDAELSHRSRGPVRLRRYLSAWCRPPSTTAKPVHAGRRPPGRSPPTFLPAICGRWWLP